MNIAICDDDRSEINLLIELINSYCVSKELECFIESYSNGDDLLEKSSCFLFDILFLDIYMEGKSGIETARIIRETNKKTLIVFTTSSAEHALDGFEVQAIHYLLKPLTPASVEEALNRCFQYLDRCDKFIQVTCERVLVRICLKELIYAETFSNLIILHTNKQCYKTYMSLSELFDTINDESFLRCHRSYIVNMNYIDRIENGNFVLNDSQIIPIRRQDRQLMRQQYTKYLFETIRGNS